MQFATDVIQLSRRRLLLMGAGVTGLCGRTYGFASDFWNKKAPAFWSPEEVHQLLNKSPWTKEVTAGTASRSNGSGINSGMGGGNSRGMGGGGMGGGNLLPPPSASFRQVCKPVAKRSATIETFRHPRVRP